MQQYLKRIRPYPFDIFSHTVSREWSLSFLLFVGFNLQVDAQSIVQLPTTLQYQSVVQSLPISLKTDQSDDNMQANLNVFFKYMNDESPTANIENQQLSEISGSYSMPRLASYSANPPTNVLVAVAPMHWNTQQDKSMPSTNVALTPEQIHHGQKVRRMAAPGIKFVNFMKNDGNFNALHDGVIQTQNDAAIPDGGNEKVSTGKPDVNGNATKDKIGDHIKFSKLLKATEDEKPIIDPSKSDTINPKDDPKPMPSTQPSGTSSTLKPTTLPSGSSKTPSIAENIKPEKLASSMVSVGSMVRTGSMLVSSNMAGEISGNGSGTKVISPQNTNNQNSLSNNHDITNASLPQNSVSQNKQLPVVASIIQSVTGPPELHRIANSSVSHVSSQSLPNSLANRHNFKLIYFDARGICEPIRLLFNYAKVPFEDARITRRQWLGLKDSTIFGKVPILEVDGKPLTYCHTISRFLARTFGLAGVTSWEQAQVDEISDFHSDVAMDLQPYLYVIAGFHQGDRETLRKQIFLPGVEKHFPVYVNLLKQANSGFFVHSGLTWIDFVISEYMTTIRHFEPAILDKYPALVKFIRKVQSLPEIFDYIAHREHHPV